MGDGDEAAMLRGIAADAGQAGEGFAKSMASYVGKMAAIEDGNVTETVATDAERARSFTGLMADRPSEVTAPTGDAVRPADGDAPSESNWTGAGHVTSSSSDAEAAYAAIRDNAGDVPMIASNTGMSEDAISQVKKHLFLTEHDVPVGPNQVSHGYFTADENIANLWNKAEQGALTPAEHDQFHSLMAHEYVESRLMESGMPYRSADPRAWDDDGTLMFNPNHFGAHEVAPLSSNGSLRLWPKLGLTPPRTPIAPDLSNIDDVVNAAREGLGR